MFKEILVKPWAGSLNSKYLLLYLLKNQIQSGDLQAVTQWAKDIGIGVQAGRAASKKLAELGYLQREDVSTTGVGRPKLHYVATEQFNQLLEKTSDVATGPAACWEQILWPAADQAADNLQELSSSQRFFLALLWALADDSATIDAVGSASLAKRAGITHSTVKNTIKFLWAAGYIRTQIPGVSSGLIFGRKPNIIVLDPLRIKTKTDAEATYSWVEHQAGIGQNGLTFVVGGGAIAEAKELAGTASTPHKKSRFRGTRSILSRGRGMGNRVEDFENADGYLYQREHLTDILNRLPKQYTATIEKPAQGVWRLHYAFANAGAGLHKHIVMVVCQVATKLLAQQAISSQGYYKMHVDADILCQLKQTVSVNKPQQDFTFGSKDWQWGLAAWLYRESYALAFSWLRERAKKTTVTLSELVECGSYVFVPKFSEDDVWVEVLAHEAAAKPNATHQAAAEQTSVSA